MSEFSEPTVVIIKHNNACGLASRPAIENAWDDALAGDPVSAFGGVICVNRNVSSALAEKMDSLFFEVLIASGYEENAVGILSKKKNRIILKSKSITYPEKQFRSALNGMLVQSRDIGYETKEQMTVVTNVAPTSSQFTDLEFANKIVKHTKSNTIVFARNGQLLASGTGQTSRVDALLQAIAKARHFNFDLNGAVMASDAFFPFPDCVEIADKAGIKAIIQPGGSVKDRESIDYCDKHQLAMVTTGRRHFKH
jgi:phosphoribosylaminoimidazolecarboxamide formyltransferase/IMP cyclohydrolase